jgi:hypothetical protein
MSKRPPVRPPANVVIPIPAEIADAITEHLGNLSTLARIVRGEATSLVGLVDSVSKTATALARDYEKIKRRKRRKR